MPVFGGDLAAPRDPHISEVPAGWGEMLGATAAEAWHGSPTMEVLGIDELARAKGDAQGLIDKALDASLSIPPLAPIAAAGKALKRGFEWIGGYDTPQPVTPELTGADAKAKVEAAGLSKILHLDESPIREGALDIMIKRAADKNRREMTMSRGPAGLLPGVMSVGTSLFVGALDPLNVGAAFIPIVGEARWGKLMASAGESAINRAGVRAGIGAVQGGAFTAAFQPLEAWATTQEGRDFTYAEALHNVLMGAGTFGLLHVGGGVAADVYRGFRGRPLYPYGEGEPSGPTPKPMPHVASTEPDPRLSIFNDVFAQLRTAGMEADESAQNASVVAERYAARGQRIGGDPYELFRQEGLEVRGPEGATAEGRAFDQAKRTEPDLFAEREAEGQTSLPGTERIGEGEQAQRAADQPLKPKAAQKPMDVGLFGDESKQKSFFQIDAYHGSPHDFTGFDLSKIGTGEGAQSYGHGLYFAEHPKTAQSYRDSLTRGDRPYKIEGPEITPPLGARASSAFDAMERFGPNARETIENWIKVDPTRASQHAETLRAYDNLVERGFSAKPLGQIYQVRIDAEPEHFLDWDRPLKEQPEILEKIRKAVPADLRDVFEANVSHGIVGANAYYNYIPSQTFAVREPGALRFGPSTAKTYEEALASVGGDRSRVRIVHNPSKEAASAALRDVGIPGVKYLDQGSRGPINQALMSRHERPTYNFVVFDDKLIEITHKNGDPVPAAQRQKILDQAQTSGHPNAPTFFSAVERTVESSKQDKASPEQWLGMIKNAAGVKAEELEWLGLEPWLKEQSGPVTKQALADYVRANRIEVKEVERGGALSATPEEQAALMNELERMERAGDLGDPNAEVQGSASELMNGALAGRAEAIGAIESLGIDDKLISPFRDRDRTPTKFSSWMTPKGLENERELVLTLPMQQMKIEVAPFELFGGNGQARWQGRGGVIEGVKEATFKIGDQEGRITHWPADLKSWDGPHPASGEGTFVVNSPNMQNAHFPSLEAATKAIEESFSGLGYGDYMGRSRGDVYRVPAGHGYGDAASDVNRLAHIFTADATIDGKKTLLIREGQSDWHAAGHKQGYKGEPTSYKVSYLDSDGYRSFEHFKDRVAADKQLATLKEAGKEDPKVEPMFDQMGIGQVPDAPFKTTWPALVLKRMIHYAAEHGYDKLAWVTGDTVAERYDLSKHVRDVQFVKSGSSGFTPHDEVRGYNSGTLTARDHDGKVVIERYVKADDLPEYIGKDISEKLLAQDAKPGSKGGIATATHSLSGLDLKIGGEFHRKLYDDVFVREANKLVKKYGAKVEDKDMLKKEVEDLRIDQDPAGDWAVYDENNPGDSIMTFGTQAEAEEFRRDRNVMSRGTALDDLRPRQVEGGWEIVDGRGDAYDEPNPVFTTRQAAQDAIAIEYEKHPAPKLTVHTLPITDDLRKAAVEQGFPLFQKGAEEAEPRGRITLSDNKAIVQLFSKANASTFMHEMGHLWLEEMIRDAAHEKATEAVRRDLQTILGWMGVAKPEDIATEHHEQWARGFEQYLREGSAPSSALAGAFARFKEWLLSIYRALTDLGTPITPEIRGVMDRMLATDEQIKAYQARRPSVAVEIIADLPPRAKTDIMQGSIASMINGEPVRAGEMVEAGAARDPRIQESIDRAGQSEDVSRETLRPKSDESAPPVDVRIDNTRDVRSGAVASKDPNGPVFIDRHIPELSPALKTADGQPANLWKYLSVHETEERRAMAEGMPYLEAHEKHATPAEKAAVEGDGVDWTAYTHEIDGYLASIEHEGVKNPPPDPHVDPEAAIGGKPHHHSENKTAGEENATAPPDAEDEFPATHVGPKAARGPRARDPETWTLLEFIASRGGIDPNDGNIGDVRGLFGNKRKFVPGFGDIVRQGGMKLDTMREAAVEAGYLHDPGWNTNKQATTTISDLLDAMDNDNRGQKVYKYDRVPEDVQRKHIMEENLRDAENRFDEHLVEADMDPTVIDPKLYKRTLEIMTREGENDPIVAFERAIAEDEERYDKAANVRRSEVTHIPGWDEEPDVTGAAPAGGAEATRRGGELAGRPQARDAGEVARPGGEPDRALGGANEALSHTGPETRAAWNELARPLRPADEPDVIAASEKAAAMPEPASLAPEPDKRVTAAEKAAAEAEAVYNAAAPYLPEDIKAIVGRKLLELDREGEDSAHVLQSGAACLAAAVGMGA